MPAGQKLRPEGTATLSTPLPAARAAEFQRRAIARGSTVSAELRKLVEAELARDAQKVAV